MPTARYAWGIDIGNRALKALKLAQDGDKLRVDDCEVIQHEQILSSAGDNKEAIVLAALKKFVDSRQIKNTPVGLAVSGTSSFARFVKLPPVEAKKIPEIVRFEAIQQIPFPLDDVEWSYQLFQSPDSPEVEVGIFAMRKELIEKQIGYLTNLGLNVQVVQPLPLAVYNAMYHEKRVDGCTMFMDAGAENTDLIIADGEGVWLRSLSIGGNSFTEALSKAVKFNFAKSESLKREAATSKYAKQIFQAMRPVFDDMVGETKRSLDFYRAGHRDSKLKKVVVLGSTFRLPGLQKYLQQNLQVPVERPETFTVEAPTDSKIAPVYTENLASLAGAYGLALQVLGDSKITSSLLPMAIRRTRALQDKTKWFITAASLILGATLLKAGRYFVDNYAYNSNEPLRTSLAADVNVAKALDNDYSNSVEHAGAKESQSIRDNLSLIDGRRYGAALGDVLSVFPGNHAPGDKSVPRPQRTYVTLTAIHCDFDPAMDTTLALNDDAFRNLASNVVYPPPLGLDTPGALGGGMPGRGPIPAPTVADAGAKRGYRIFIKGNTPGPQTYVDPKLINLISALDQKWAEKNGVPYYVARVVPSNVGPIKEGSDPLTGESMADDTEFTLVIAVQFIEKAPVPPPTGN